MISIALEWFRTPKPISGLGLDWIGWYPGGRRYRAPYGANKDNIFFEKIVIPADKFQLDLTDKIVARR